MYMLSNRLQIYSKKKAGNKKIKWETLVFVFLSLDSRTSLSHDSQRRKKRPGKALWFDLSSFLSLFLGCALQTVTWDVVHLSLIDKWRHCLDVWLRLRMYWFKKLQWHSMSAVMRQFAIGRFQLILRVFGCAKLAADSFSAFDSV